MEEDGGAWLLDRDCDPSLMFANSAPAPRQDVWREGMRLVKEASSGPATGALPAYSPLPGTARGRTQASRGRQTAGSGRHLVRGRTRQDRAQGQSNTEPAHYAVAGSLPVQPARRAMGGVPIFCNRAGTPYTKDQLGDDFRDVPRCSATTRRRQLADFRRSVRQWR